MNTKWIYEEGDTIKNFFKYRGFKTKKEIDKYLNFSPSQLRNDYIDLDKVVDRLIEAIEQKEKLVIYGDYDCDGICATTIVLLALRKLGYEADYFINDRFKEGYGMNERGVCRLLTLYPDTELILTCDNGITAYEGIRLALDAGIEVLCTDHHLPKGNLIVPTIDEWRADEDESLREESCGAELARRVMKRLYEKLGEDTDYIEKLITFSGIATVADVVKFTAANRYIVKRCLELLNEPVFPIITLIKDVLKLSEIDEETVGFVLGPLMNCMSRVTGSPNEMVEILTSKANTVEVYEKLKEAIAYNEQRKQMTLENLEKAKLEIDENQECIVLAGDYHPGIAGLVASSVVELYNRPCICLAKNGELLKGSARTYMTFHLKKALDKCADLLVVYGGHAGAAGLSIRPENLEAFTKKMCSIVRKSGVLEKEHEIHVDYECSISNMFDDTVKELMSLAPFGTGFEKPKIVYYGQYKALCFMPKDAEVPKHISFMLKDDKSELKAVWWNSYEKWKQMAVDSKDQLAVMGAPRIECFNDSYYRKLYVEDMKIRQRGN